MSDQSQTPASQPRRSSLLRTIFGFALGIMATVAVLYIALAIYADRHKVTTAPTPVVQTSTTPAVDPMIATLRTELAVYGWTTAEVDAIVAAYQAGAVSTKRVTGSWYDQLWSTSYGKRWSEANLVAHLRDEHPNGADLMVITTGDRRYSILWDGCGGIEKIAIGVKPVPVKIVVRKVYVQKPQPPAPVYDPYRVRCGTCEP